MTEEMKEVQWGIGEHDKLKEVMAEMQEMWDELYKDLEFLHEIPKGMRSTQVAITILYLMRKGVI
jgi:hypothetical protein